MTIAKDGSLPIHSGITLVSQTANSITIRIAASSVPVITNNIPILLQLNPRTIDDGTTFEKIFTELGTSWDKLYVKDGGTNQNLYTDTWDIDEPFGRVWVVLDSITTASKDLLIEFDILSIVNPLSKWIGVNVED